MENLWLCVRSLQLVVRVLKSWLKTLIVVSPRHEGSKRPVKVWRYQKNLPIVSFLFDPRPFPIISIRLQVTFIPLPIVPTQLTPAQRLILAKSRLTGE